MLASRLPILWFTASLFLGGAGCELVAQVDRSQIGGTSSGSGGSGGSTTATSTVTSTATSGTGGTGGTGGAGGAGGSGGATATSTATSSGTGGAGGATSSSSASSTATGTGGAGGATSSSSSSSASGTGGAGGSTGMCSTPAECPPPANECVTATCIGGACGTANVPAGTLTAMQTPGDCLMSQCDGSGAIVTANDDPDINDDSNPCTTDACSGGVGSHTPVAAGIACGAGQVCNATGSCVGCVVATTCPGVDDECKTRTCTANVCGFSFTAAGTVTAAQTASDCQKNQCNGAGVIVPVADNTDLPVDNLQCTSDVCTAGAPTNPPTASGSACTQNGGTACNGTGQCVQCVTASTCPGQDTDCQTRTCTAGACGFSFAAAGTTTPTGQTPANCQKLNCNGSGGVVSVADNSDTPLDGNACTTDSCNAGVPTFTPVAAGTSCGAGLVCDAAGTCLGCNTGADCPGTDTECHTRTCVANTCGVAFTAAGTATAAQTAGDCKQNECDGSGNIVSANHNADVPSDAFQCTADTCTAGVPTFTPVASGTACSQAGGTLCDATGDCVQCNAATDCPGTDTDCHVRTCPAGTCGVVNTAAGNPTSTQTASNCQINQCDGAGNAVNVADNSDVPVDGNQCTGDVCTAGVPSNPNLAAGTACTQSGGTICNGAGTCAAAGGTPTDFLVLRVGDGVAALSSASTAGFLEHHNLDGTTAGTTVNLPVAVSGANKPLTFAGTSTSEGGLSLSGDGHYVTMAGYAAAPGVAAIAGTTSAVNNRVVGRLDATLIASTGLDTSTVFPAAFSAANIRSATTNDGTSFWASGSAGAVEYISFGGVTATQLNTTPTNIRFLHVIGGQLYGTSGSGAFVNVFSVGTGLPTMSGQAATSFPGMPVASGPSPYSFVLLDRNAAVAGLDTLYVADDRAVGVNTGGIQKWTFDGTTWTLIKTLTAGAAGFRGLAGVVTGANVTLIATTTATSANAIVAFVDDGSAAPVGTVIATAPTNTVYRGIAFAPK